MTSSYLPAMEKPAAKFFILLFVVSAVPWLASFAVKNIHVGTLLEFGTLEFRSTVTPESERTAYRYIAEYSLYSIIAYPVMLFSAAGFIRTTNRSLRKEGWLLMSAILLFLFIPVELYYFWLDWKIVGLTYWGEWPIDEFRKALLARVTAMAGLPFIAQLCYYTIPILIIFKPLQHSTAAQ